ncbi:hypothetical protein SDC9_181748 [bioreactor metagenome]|uniref:Uncharacterized protein n=1 Tax=bioreactor metagenome TaxID=1076179 RepID=A0A645H5H8_9ZZZZ
MLSFHAVKSTALDIGEQLLLGHRGHLGGGVGNGKEFPRALVDHHVRALRGEDGRDQQLKG